MILFASRQLTSRVPFRQNDRPPRLKSLNRCHPLPITWMARDVITRKRGDGPNLTRQTIIVVCVVWRGPIYSLIDLSPLFMHGLTLMRDNIDLTVTSRLIREISRNTKSEHYNYTQFRVSIIWRQVRSIQMNRKASLPCTMKSKTDNFQVITIFFSTHSSNRIC